MFVPAISSSIWFGYEIVTFFTKGKWDYLTRLCSGFSIGFVTQAFFVMILQLDVPWGKFQALLVISIFTSISVLAHWFNQRYHPIIKIRLSMIDLVSLVVWIGFITYRLSLVYFHYGMYTRGAAYSDFNFHFQYISSFAVGCNKNRKSFFDIQTIMSSGSKLAYPTLVNFHAAFLYASCDASFADSVKWTAFLNGISFIYLLHRFSLQFTKNSLSASIAIPLWIFSGGLGFLTFKFDQVNTQNSANEQNYIHAWGKGRSAFWFQSLAHIFHPQRSATFTLPLCLITIMALMEGIKKWNIRMALLAAIPVSVMPQTQVHGYVSIAIFSMSLAAFSLPSGKKFWKALFFWTAFGVTANIIAIPLCMPYFQRTAAVSNEFFKWNPIWKNKHYAEEPLAFFKVFWNGLGCFGLIALICGFVTANKEQLLIYGSSIPVLLIGSTIMFQPWELDNTKILHASWFLIACPFVAQYFTYLFQSNNFFIMIIALVILFSCMMSGILCITITESFDAPFYDPERAEQGRWVSENTAVDAIFQMSTHVMIPASSFAGRQMFVGYLGWISSHGLANSTKSSAAALIEAGNNAEETRKWNVSYLIKKDLDEKKTDPTDSVVFWETTFSKGEYRIWRFMSETEAGVVRNETKTPARNRRVRKPKRTYNF